MERKTLGSFLAALRKASGMTQKELAEKLNVTDKSVSRWEREESLPDLALIPVIAEIFGITTDELLRGERRPGSETQEQPAGRTQKQLRRIMEAGKTRYRNQSLISLGIGGLGLLAAMICNFGFNRAYIGFFLGMAFYLAAVICQAIFVNGAFLATRDEELAGPDVEAFRNTIVSWAGGVFGVLLVLFSGCLPLLVFPGDAYWGLAGDSWLLYGLIFGAAGGMVWEVCRYFGKEALLNRGVITMTEGEYTVYRHNRKLKGRCALVLAAVLAVSCFLEGALTGFGDPLNTAKGESFDNFEDFKAYMEQDIPRELPLSSDSGMIAPERAPEEDGQIHYYDKEGNEITEDEYRTRPLKDREGNVIGTYIHRNQSVIQIKSGPNTFPIRVFTEQHRTSATIRAGTVHVLFLAVYLLEVVTTLVVYFMERKTRKK